MHKICNLTPSAHAMLLPIRVFSSALALAVSASKLDMYNHHGVGVGPLASSPSAIIVTTPTAVVNASLSWSWYSLASQPWATKSDTSFALWGAGTYSAYAWGSGPDYIAEYSCQAPYILEKLLSLGGPSERNLAAQWLLTMPVSQVGKVWEAQNTEWHVGNQGTWESQAEAILSARLFAAHGEGAFLATAPERLVCATQNNGVTWKLVGVEQPGLTDAVCIESPKTLVVPPSLQPPAPAPFLFSDAPSIQFSGPSSSLNNSGRIITQAILLTSSVDGLSVPLYPKNSRTFWPGRVSVARASDGVVLGSVATQASSSSWTVLTVSLPPGLYVLALSLEEGTLPPGVTKASDSWFLSSAWVSNGRPKVGGGGGQGTYGHSVHWVRDTTAPPPGSTHLHQAYTGTQGEALALEAARVNKVHALGGDGVVVLGRSVVDYLSMAMSYNLALSSQVIPGQYDVYVIPDAGFRGALRDGVDSGCSYYDLLRIGFASSYINLRVLESVLAYNELQAAGIIPATCTPANSAFGVDNALLLDPHGTLTPCYTSEEVSALATTMRTAIGSRFSSPTTGAWVDWYGCDAMGENGGDVAACGLAKVVNATLPSGSPLNAQSTGFLPTIALAAKLGVPAGGSNISATLAQFVEALSWGASDGAMGGCGTAGSSGSGRSEGNGGVGESNASSNYFYGGGYFHTNLCPLEGVPNGAAATIAGGPKWALKDPQGFAVRSQEETGDWHVFPLASIAGGASRGYGSWAAQGENGGRFFTTSAMLWEAVNAPHVLTGGNPPPSPYPSMVTDWGRMVSALQELGEGISNATQQPGVMSTPLLPLDRGFLSVPVEDPLINYLCAKVRKQFNFPNVTDRWGQRLCEYYQDLGFGTPENGVAMYSFVKGMLGMHVLANGSVVALGNTSPPPPLCPWKVSAPLPQGGFPSGVTSLVVEGLAIQGTPHTVDCSVMNGSVECTFTCNT